MSGALNHPVATLGNSLAVTSTGASYFTVIGPIVIGIIWSIFGCGLFVAQVYIYLTSYLNDSRSVKVLLGVVLAMNVGQSAADASRLIKLTTMHPGDLLYFLDIKSRPEEFISPIFSLLICSTVQAFLARRCFLFARISQSPTERESMGFTYRSWVLGFLLGLGLGLSFGTSVGTIVALGRLPNYMYASRTVDTSGLFPILTAIWLTSSAGLDVLISGVIVFELRQAVKHKEKKDRMLASLIQIAIQSGTIVTTLQIVTLICYFQSHSGWADFSQIFISKVYSITLVSALFAPKEAARPRSPANQNAQLPLPMSVPRFPDSWRSQPQDSRRVFPFPARHGVVRQMHFGDGDNQSTRMMIHGDDSSGDLSHLARLGTPIKGRSTEKVNVKTGDTEEMEHDFDDDKEMGVLELHMM